MTARPPFITTCEPLACHTTFKLGGPADFFAWVGSLAELEAALAYASAADLPVQVLGGGSNVVFADAGFRGLVIKLALHGVSAEVDADTVAVTAAAGEPWDALVRHTTTRGWWGLENLAAIPGAVGGAPVQNVGAYGVEAKDAIAAVEVFDAKAGARRSLAPAACAFGYRDSIFKQPEQQHLIITSVTFTLSRESRPVTHYPDLATRFPEPPLHPEVVREAVSQIRSAKFPDIRTVGTAGSFFKNPVLRLEHFHELQERWPELKGHGASTGVKVSAGWLIDVVAGARGARAGAIGTHDAHALVFVHHGGGTTAALDAFAREIEARVQAATGIMLEREVEFVAAV